LPNAVRWGISSSSDLADAELPEHAVVRWLIILLCAAEAGWMVFDGGRALIVGDYVTPTSGPHAGQLGPWAGAVSAIGLDPRSTATKLGFVCFGLAWLVLGVAFARRASWAWTPMLAAAVASLWYAPVGTALSAVQILLLLLPSVRQGSS
jgi:hypothetical protein